MTAHDNKNKTVRAWVDRHINDHYVKSAKHDGYRSRAAYKLLEINNKFNLLGDLNGTIVVDLGCAPGSWSQVALKTVQYVLGVDLQNMEALHGLEFIQGDFTDNVIFDQLCQATQNRHIGVVLSDLSPNISGVQMVDQAKMAHLNELVLEFVSLHLKQHGKCVMKTFYGQEFDYVLKTARAIFKCVHVFKPGASRSESKESYLVCIDKK